MNIKLIPCLCISSCLAIACSDSSGGGSADGDSESDSNADPGDASSGDASSGDASSGDASSGDASSGDAGPTDSGPTDAGPTDSGPTDSSADTGPGPESSGKRGIAYGHHSDADLTVLQPAVTWWYNWAYEPDTELSSGTYETLEVDYVPMVWGGTFDVDAITAGIPEGATTLLGFNEPNFGAQANLSAAQAAALWPEVEQIADARGLTLVSPAVNYCGGDCQDTDPFNYLDEFFAACQGCRVDRVAFHVYVGCHPDGDNKAQWLIDHIETYKTRYSQPLWLTEFACTDAANFEDQVAFLEDAVDYLEHEPRIERYSWFSGRFEWIPYVDLLGADGELTPLGQAYVNAPVFSE